ncbi:DUF4433 domain-containing protein [Leptolyngbya sp. 7M]|uniref:type II toxin-antitoxin system toxin DNA ADP-ribosyl transferase DarT n=1 Tax=Leptolyngbya sp. 7M TaxID=2812896 RepID=UPI001B8DAA4C|nr:DUF4433 domain-containing protein [Leptolyngbya sp. 7M]QYO62608.1 DUF4433 domain-containing protein [Leptolyngbya sp. 7M]QYU70933.1 DUF4433 domain-containing protein [Leptolyngbya sp. 15MV]
MLDLSPENALMFRITHRDNIPWILDNGIHCRNSPQVDPNFVNIGNTELVGKRTRRNVPTPPFGTLSDYVPFYFTPRSIMLLNILTGYNGVRKRQKEEIVIIVTSLPKLRDRGKPFLFTDRHAYLVAAQFSNDLADLDALAWDDWRNSDFSYDAERPDKKERYQAEALACQNLGMDDLLGFATCSATSRDALTAVVEQAGFDTKVLAKSSWYF